MSRDRRLAERKSLEFIEAEDLTVFDGFDVVASRGFLKTASTISFVVVVERRDLRPPEFKETLDLSVLEGKEIALFLPQMSLDLDGTIQKVRHSGKGAFEFVIKFSDEVPMYWRESLVELLPAPGELEAV